MGFVAMAEKTRYSGHGVFAALPDASFEKSGTETGRPGIVHHTGTVPIPKSSSVKRVEENRKAWDITLEQSVLDELDGIFPPPDHKMPLDVL